MLNELEKMEIINTINIVKKDVINTRNKTIYSANKEMINLYFRIGKIISQKSSYGKKFVELLSSSLKIEFPNITGFSERNLWRMKAFYEEYQEFIIVPPMVAQLPWTHNYILIEKIKSKNERAWYAKECLKNNWSKNMLIHQIELKLYNRQHTTLKMNNFNKKISIKNNSILANEILKDPYIFEIEGINNNILEKELEKKMIEKIKNILLEFGNGFSFIGNEYKISTNDCDYYIDMLFYHIELHCYIVVELKTSTFKPEYIGQLGFYVKAVDETLKKDIDNQTIGLLLCKEKDKLSVEWALDIVNVPIGVSSYNIINKNNQELLEKLPTEEDINTYLNLS